MTTPRHWVVPAVLSVALIVTLLWATNEVHRATSGTFDETIYLHLGRQLLAGDWSQLTSLGVAPLPVRLIWNRQALNPGSASATDAAVYRTRVARARRNAVWLAAVPLVLLVFAWSATAHGLAAGGLAAALLTLSPNFVAHASLATTDVAFALAFVSSLMALIAYLHRPSWLMAGVLATALGLALATKYSALGLLACAVVLFARDYRTSRLRLDAATLVLALVVAWGAHGWTMAPLVVQGGSATAAVDRFLGWTGASAEISAWLQSVPFPAFIRGIAAQLYLDRAGQEAFLLGQTSPHGWWYYFPVALALKSTPVELLCFALFAGLAVIRRGRDVETTVLSTAIVLYGGAALASHRDLGVRYLLPIIVVAVAGGVGWLADALRPYRGLSAMLGIFAVVLQGASFVSIAPEHLAYFNALSGGPSRGYQKLVDSNLDWGQDLPGLANWLKTRGTNRVQLAYFGSAPPTAYGIESVPFQSAAAGAEAPSWVAVSATYLQGVFVCGDPFAGFRSIEPSGRGGYSIMIYDAHRDEVRAALAATAADPCAP